MALETYPILEIDIMSRKGVESMPISETPVFARFTFYFLRSRYVGVQLQA